jgi:hypothetical protein
MAGCFNKDTNKTLLTADIAYIDIYAIDIYDNISY